jgi:hypothetical protein
MVDIKELIRQAGDLRRQADHEVDPKVRDRLNRMADAYVHIAETEAGTEPASVHSAMEALAQTGEQDQASRPDTRKSASPPAPATGSMKQTNEPWNQPVEKEQAPGHVSPNDLERWQKTSTH